MLPQPDASGEWLLVVRGDRQGYVPKSYTRIEGASEFAAAKVQPPPTKYPGGSVKMQPPTPGGTAPAPSPRPQLEEAAPDVQPAPPASMPPSWGRAGELASNVFDILDQDHSGALSTAEGKCYLRTLGCHEEELE